MLKHKHIDKICIIIVSVGLIITTLFVFGENLGLQRTTAQPPYVGRIFDDSKVHSIELLVDDWGDFLANAAHEEYVSCTVVIDGEKFSNVGLRVKGNNSKSLIGKYGLDRYSLKLEFDHYTDGSYYGLDKLNLDASYQDNSYMKNYLAYDMMDHIGVPTPLCSYAWVTVNGEDRGLFLALEEPEEAFARRIYGKNHGQLYKPDYKSIDHENADVALRYTDDDFDSYDNIFRNAKFNISDRDKSRLVDALKQLDTGGPELENAINIDEVIRYFTVQVFVVNLDSYLGPTGHNYFLYEEDGKLSMIPWDYNLAYATYPLGMPEPINDARMFVNYPIDTPAAGYIMVERPMFHNLMLQQENFDLYHQYFSEFIASYFESGYFEEKVQETSALISPYVKKDPTAFCSYEDHELAVETITNFCLLRAQSIRGQLDGTIPSTIKGQSDDDSALIDASSVWVPDMGEIADLTD